jgi:sarcosine oxidase subunit alpha
VLVVGGGIAGLQAALMAGQAGKRVIVLEQTAHWGGRAPVDGDVIDGLAADAWVSATVQALERWRMSRCACAAWRRASMTTAMCWPMKRWPTIPPATGGQSTGCGASAPERSSPRRRDRAALSFAGNDIPGVMLASAVRDYVVNWAVSPGDRTVVATNNDDAYRTAIALKEAGLEVPVVDARTSLTGDLPARAKAWASGSRPGAPLSRSRAASA